MPTIINPNISEVISFDKLHVDEFIIHHVRSEGPPPRHLIVRATSYGINSAGKRVYNPQTHEEEMKDFDPVLIQQWCVKNNKTFPEALAKINQYKQKLATDLATGNIDELYLMVAVELGVAKVIEMMGIFDILEVN